MAFLAGRYTATIPLPGLPTGAPPPVASPVAASPKQASDARLSLDECRDQCEQTAIMTKATDLQLKACRARCDADHVIPVVPNEVPRSITVAPADHRAR